MVEKCPAVTQAGSPCAATVRPGRAWCAWHDPDLADRRAAWSRKGGQGKSNQARARKQLPDGLMTPVELRGLLGIVLKAVIAGRLEPGVGNAAANLARAMTSILETQELEERITALESRAGLGEGKTA